MNQDVFQLTYRSKAVQGIQKKHIIEIVEEAKAFNKRSGITGCLVFDKGYFVQILEGDKDTVEALYQSIKQDNRHNHFDILSTGWADERLFSSWDMGYVAMDDLMMGQKEDVVKKARIALDTISVKRDFTPKVFWYNVYHLLTGSKFYKDK